MASLNRRLILCFDGTMQDGLNEAGNLDTNIYRIAKSINKLDTRGPKAIHQLVFYISGVGTEESTFQSIFDSSTGGGLMFKVQEAYSFIQMNWTAGDEIFLFGFSRGAYTARMVAGLIGKLGILSREDMMGDFTDIFAALQRPANSIPPPVNDKQYAKYQASTNKLNVCIAKAKTQITNLSCDFLVNLLCCYDTVGSMGAPQELYHHTQASVPGIFGFSDTNLGEHVALALHALALNETREDFLPIKFTQTPAGVAKGQVLKQTWFLGSHSDVGGGYFPHDLADITLAWVISNTSSILSYDEGFINKLSLPAFNWGIQIPNNPRTGIYYFSDKAIRSPPTTNSPGFTNETYHSSVLQQLNSAYVTSIVAAALKLPSMIEPLSLFEEQVKSNWKILTRIIPALLHLPPAGPPPPRSIQSNVPPLSPPLTPGLLVEKKEVVPEKKQNVFSGAFKKFGKK